MPLPHASSRAAPSVVGHGLRIALAARQSQRQRQLQPQRVFFHATSLHRDSSQQNHYEILNVQPGASQAEVKKAFYQLSKTHHPDHNPDDAAAPQRFMRISDAYGVLGHPDKRAAYDRDVLRLHIHHPHEHARRGSYHSTNPAGGRPPSGLSRRRTTFTGPPPSFFRSGGWGNHGDKRRAAHEETTASSGSGAGAQAGGAAYAGMGGSGRWAGMGPGQDPYGHQDDVPHFDQESHQRSGEAGATRRHQQHTSKKRVEAHDMGLAQGFFVISGILIFAVIGPIVLFGGWWSSDKGDAKKKKGRVPRSS